MSIKNGAFYLGRIFLVTLGVGIAAVLSELYLFLAGYSLRPTVWFFSNQEYDKDRVIYNTNPWEIYEYKKNSTIVRDYWETDIYGFRKNPQHTSIINKGSILVIGDSFAYGHGVRHEEAWPYLLEQKLRSSNPTLLVYNAAVAATGTDQQYVRLHRYVKEFHPRAVIWMIDTNDMLDSDLACLFSRNDNGSYTQIPGFFNVAYLNGVLLEHLPSWFIKTRFGNLLTSFTLQGRDLATPGCTRFADKQDLPSTYFSKLRYLLLDTNNRLRSQNIKLFVFLAPVQWYFDLGYANTGYEVLLINNFRSAIRNADVAFLDFNSEIAYSQAPSLFTMRSDSLKEENVSVAGVSNSDLNYSLFNNEGQDSYGSWHLNAEGNEVVASMVYNLLLSNSIAH